MSKLPYSLPVKLKIEESPFASLTVDGELFVKRQGIKYESVVYSEPEEIHSFLCKYI